MLGVQIEEARRFSLMLPKDRVLANFCSNIFGPVKDRMLVDFLRAFRGRILGMVLRDDVFWLGLLRV